MKETKGHNYIKTESRVMLRFTAHHLIKPYICTKVHEEKLNSFKVLEQTQNITGNKQRGIIISELKVVFFLHIV